MSDEKKVLWGAFFGSFLLCVTFLGVLAVASYEKGREAQGNEPFSYKVGYSWGKELRRSFDGYGKQYFGYGRDGEETEQ